jgi:tetratricopeptide (TPR) repeat protein
MLGLFLSDAYIQRARTVIYTPAQELSAARKAATFDPWSVTPLYLEASALESMGDRPAAYKQLRNALSLEPHNVATLGVLGDFEARGGNLAAARRYYSQALAVDPLDTGLRQLARIGERVGATRTAARTTTGKRHHRRA